MRLGLVSLAFIVSACGFRPPQPDESSVTVKLPPPKGMAGPGFGSPVVDRG